MAVGCSCLPGFSGEVLPTNVAPFYISTCSGESHDIRDICSQSVDIEVKYVYIQVARRVVFLWPTATVTSSHNPKLFPAQPAAMAPVCRLAAAAMLGITALSQQRLMLRSLSHPAQASLFIVAFNLMYQLFLVQSTAVVSACQPAATAMLDTVEPLQQLLPRLSTMAHVCQFRAQPTAVVSVYWLAAFAMQDTAGSRLRGRHHQRVHQTLAPHSLPQPTGLSMVPRHFLLVSRRLLFRFLATLATL